MQARDRYAAVYKLDLFISIAQVTSAMIPKLDAKLILHM